MLWIHEAVEDDTYEMSFMHIFNLNPVRVLAGDTDGDGDAEVLVSADGYPTSVHIFKTTLKNDFYFAAVLSGVGGHASFAGALDLDGDDLPMTVFSDDNYPGPGHETTGSVYGYEDGKMFYWAPDAQLRTASLGDLDGNGLGEIIGTDPATGNLKILESTGSNNEFESVYDQATDYSPQAIDQNRDGQHELWKATASDSGALNILSLAHRSGNALEEFYNSGEMFSDYNDDIKGVLAVGDTNGDGSMELAVIQGSLLHIVETSSHSAPGDLSGLITKIDGADIPDGLKNALTAKLENAQKSLDRGNTRSFENHMNAFINQVQAQSDKQIPTDVAQQLIDQAERIVQSINN
jgi:hypothetical protein